MTEEIKNLRNLAKQLIDTGKQLDHEATKKEFERATNDLFPDILTDFNWKINRGESGCWYVIGKPINERAKFLLKYAHSFHPMYDHPSYLMLKEKLKQIGNPYDLHINVYPELVWTIPFTKELLNWINTYQHLQITNLSETVDKLRPEIKAKEEECQQFKDLTEALRSQNPVDNESIDWKKVASGEQQAPQFIKISAKRVDEGAWIYVGNHHMIKWRDLRSFKEALELLKETTYSALYRDLGDGRAKFYAIQDPPQDPVDC